VAGWEASRGRGTSEFENCGGVGVLRRRGEYFATWDSRLGGRVGGGGEARLLS